MRYISTPPPTPPPKFAQRGEPPHATSLRKRGGERLRQQMRGGVPTVLQASKNRYISSKTFLISICRILFSNWYKFC